MNLTYSSDHLLQQVAAVLGRQTDQVLQGHLGIGFSQYKILLALHRHSHIQQRQIAKELGQTEASISRQIKLLTELHMLSAQINPQNRRERSVVLTPKGVHLIEEACNTLESYYDSIFGALSDKQRAEFEWMLKHIYEQARKLEPSGISSEA
jgi:DNA-binding MarR family transcriptional regulator